MAVLQPSALTILYYTYGAIAGAIFLAALIATSAVYIDTRVTKYARRKARREARRHETNRGNTNPGYQQELEPVSPTAPPPHPSLVTTTLTRRSTLPPPYESQASEYLAPMNEEPAASPSPIGTTILPIGTSTRRPPQTPLPNDPIYQAIEAARLRDQQMPPVNQYESSIPNTDSDRRQSAMAATPQPSSPIQAEDDQQPEPSFSQPLPVQSAILLPSKQRSTTDDDVFMAKTKLTQKPSMSKRPIQESLSEEKPLRSEEHEQGKQLMTEMPTNSSALEPEPEVFVKGPVMAERPDSGTVLPVLENIATPIECPSEGKLNNEETRSLDEIKASGNELANKNGPETAVPVIDGMREASVEGNQNNKDDSTEVGEAREGSIDDGDNTKIPKLKVPEENVDHPDATEQLKDHHSEDGPSEMYAVVDKGSINKIPKELEEATASQKSEEDGEKDEKQSRGSESLTDISIAEVESLNMNILDDFEEMLRETIEDTKQSTSLIKQESDKNQAEESNDETQEKDVSPSSS